MKLDQHIWAAVFAGLLIAIFIRLAPVKPTEYERDHEAARLARFIRYEQIRDGMAGEMVNVFLEGRIKRGEKE